MHPEREIEVGRGLLRDADARLDLARRAGVRALPARETLLGTVASTGALLLLERHLTLDRTRKEYL